MGVTYGDLFSSYYVPIVFIFPLSAIGPRLHSSISFLNSSVFLLYILHMKTCYIIHQVVTKFSGSV